MYSTSWNLEILNCISLPSIIYQNNPETAPLCNVHAPSANLLNGTCVIILWIIIGNFTERANSSNVLSFQLLLITETLRFF